MNLLDIEVPIIAAVNGPVRIHAQLAVCCDIAIVSHTATCQDNSHFINHDIMPCDGVATCAAPLPKQATDAHASKPMEKETFL